MVQSTSMGLAAQKLMLGPTGSASTTFSDEAGLVTASTLHGASVATH